MCFINTAYYYYLLFMFYIQNAPTSDLHCRFPSHFLHLNSPLINTPLKKFKQCGICIHTQKTQLLPYWPFYLPKLNKAHSKIALFIPVTGIFHNLWCIQNSIVLHRLMSATHVACTNICNAQRYCGRLSSANVDQCTAMKSECTINGTPSFRHNENPANSTLILNRIH